MNSAVMHLAGVAEIGTTVIVVAALPSTLSSPSPRAAP